MPEDQAGPLKALRPLTAEQDRALERKMSAEQEVRAMEQIGRALALLGPPAQARVLRWAMARCREEAAGRVGAPAIHSTSEPLL